MTGLIPEVFVTAFDNRLNTKRAGWNHLEKWEVLARTKWLHTDACSLQTTPHKPPTYLYPAGSLLRNQYNKNEKATGPKEVQEEKGTECAPPHYPLESYKSSSLQGCNQRQRAQSPHWRSTAQPSPHETAVSGEAKQPQPPGLVRKGTRFLCW